VDLLLFGFLLCFVCCFVVSGAVWTLSEWICCYLAFCFALFVVLLFLGLFAFGVLLK
jgi:cobalamin biosynthesis protein CobD/CbiB